jgi:hypothetical protein
MVDFHDAVSLLRAKRQELLHQLNAVEKALAALGDAGLAVTSTAEANPQEATDTAASAVLPTRLKAPRTLSDEHKHALNEGRRKARHSKDAAAGSRGNCRTRRPGWRRHQAPTGGSRDSSSGPNASSPVRGRELTRY